MSGQPDFAASRYHNRRRENLRPVLAYGGGDVAVWQNRLRPKLREAMGYALHSPAPLNPRTLWKKAHPLGTIEKVVFSSEPGADAMAYVCVPKDAKPPHDFWICVQGHNSGAHLSISRAFGDEDTPVVVEGDREFGLQCMARGMAAVCLEQRGFGERCEAPNPPAPEGTNGCFEPNLHALVLGQTLIGGRVYDVERAVDYLAARGDARMDRIGVMGNSGGGTTSVFAAALVPRLAFAMPSCYFCDFSHWLFSINHCGCNYVPGLLNLCGMADILGLFAPRPVTVVAGDRDDLVPVDGVRAAFEDLRRIYRAAGAPDACRLVIGSGGHRFYADDAWPVMRSLAGR